MHAFASILISFAVLNSSLGQTPSSTVPRSTVRLDGRWVLDADGRPTPPESFTRGLQTSGLLFREKELWAIGDQRSRYPGQLLRISPRTARLLEAPIPLRLSEATRGAAEDLQSYARIPNSDFEGLCLHPREPDTLFAVTEDKIPWIVEIHIEKLLGTEPTVHRATIVRLTQIRFPDVLKSWREDTNFRFEGLAIQDDADRFFLAFERASDNLPKIYQAPVDSVRSQDAVTPELVPIRFDAVPARADKPRSLLNVNDIQFYRLAGRPYLLAVLRDQERLVRVDIERGSVEGVVDLDFRDPTGAKMMWVSPEGIAADSASDRLWIINDPDSVRGNYRALDSETPEGAFAEYTPLLFEWRLSEITRRT